MAIPTRPYFGLESFQVAIGILLAGRGTTYPVSTLPHPALLQPAIGETLIIFAEYK